MTDEEISELFHELIDQFPAQHQEAALDWLVKREAAHEIIEQMAAGTFKFMSPTEAPEIENAPE